ncbi:MAG: DUF2442 domain-containing protein [Odoribacter sp.]|nr:DUF2442 domain-containing protein [Odoribacter sp.]
MNTVKTPIRKNIKISRLGTRFIEMPTIKNVSFDKEAISFILSDYRTITIPIVWVPKLEKASKTTREKFVIRGHFVFWEDIDEIIGVKNLLNGSIIPG